MIRVVTVIKAAAAHMKKRIYPNGIFPVRVGEDVIKDDVLISISGFIAIYLATGLIGSAIISLSGCDMITAIAASFLCLGNIGIGFGAVGPTGNFADFAPFFKWLCAFLMLVGRLELYTVFALFTRSFGTNKESVNGCRRYLFNYKKNKKKQPIKGCFFYYGNRMLFYYIFYINITNILTSG